MNFRLKLLLKIPVIEEEQIHVWLFDIKQNFTSADFDYISHAYLTVASKYTFMP